MSSQSSFCEKTKVKNTKSVKKKNNIKIDVNSIREENEKNKSQKNKNEQLLCPKKFVENPTYKNIEEEDDTTGTTKSCTQEVNTKDNKIYNKSTEKADIGSNNRHTNFIILEKKEIKENINMTNKNIINQIVNVINVDNKNKLIPKIKLPIYQIYCHSLNPETQIYLNVKNERNKNNTIHTTNYIQYEDIENESTRDVTREINKDKENTFKNNIQFNIINNNKDIILHERPVYKIPIDDIKKEGIKKNKNIKNKNNINNKLNEKIIVENLKRNLNPNICPGISNILLNTNPFMGNNKQMGIQNNVNNVNNVYNINNNIYNNNKIAQITEIKIKFQKLKELGLYAMMNPQNMNHYLLNLYINNINRLNQCLTYNNINYNFNNLGNQNPLLQNYMNNQNFMNLNRMNNYNGINTLNNLTNLNNQKYTITIKNKTNDPTIEKVSKIQVTTYCVKDNSKIKPENNDTVKKEKNIKNIINLDNIKSGKETRTVVRLNPIPPNYSSFDVCKLLDKYLQIESGKNQRIYKALYTPLCKIIGKNLGYCFVMMVKPKYVLDFYKTFNGKSFGKKKCKKPCKVIWADIQGEDFLKASEDDPIRKPIIFKDIRDD